MTMTTEDALERLEEIAREHPIRYVIHLAHMDAEYTLCGGLVEDYVGRRKHHNTFEVVGNTNSLPYWQSERNVYCPVCAEHEDYPLFVLGAA